MAISSSDDIAKRLTKARIGLSLRHPFLSSAVMRLPFKNSNGASWCPTMATDGYHIFFNAVWVADLVDAEIEGVIAHEVLHVVFGHPDRQLTRDPENWNIACDHAINLLLLAEGLSLPAAGLMDRRFIGMSAEEIYAQLTASGILSPSIGQSGNGVGAVVPGAAPEGSGGERKLPWPDLLDPGDLRIQAVQDADAPDTEGRRSLRESLAREIQSQLHGMAAAMYSAEIESVRKRRIDWRALLRRWLSERIKSDWSSFPFSKRHVWRGFYMPSPGVQAPGHIVFAVDTSGSMSVEQIATIAAEIRAFRETFLSRLTILQCDATIQSVEEYEQEDPTPVPQRFTAKGRGGTDFRPIFDYVDKNVVTHQVVIVATDGFGEYPERAPPYPCLWIHLPNSIARENVPFGDVVHVAL